MGYIAAGGSNSTKSNKAVGVGGLVNLGSTCFLNTVLQAFASCEFVQAWLRQQSGVLALSLRGILRELNESNGDLSPHGVIDAMRTHGWRLTGDEQDSHELYHILCDTLNEENVKPQKESSLSDVLQDVQPAHGVVEKLPALDITTLRYNLPLQGLLSNLLTCSVCCQSYPVTHDAFHSLSLSFPPDNNTMLSSQFTGGWALSHLLQHFVRKEIVDEVSCAHCSKARLQPVKNVFYKQQTIGRLPQTLCFHIQRTAWMDIGREVKRFDHVVFPEILSMDKYMYSNMMQKREPITAGNLRGGCAANAPSHVMGNNSTCTSIRDKPATDKLNVSMIRDKMNTVSDNNKVQHAYTLKAVVVHIGSISSGHFATYRLTSSGERFYISDTYVKLVSRTDVFSASAYMLLYEKISYPQHTSNL